MFQVQVPRIKTNKFFVHKERYQLLSKYVDGNRSAQKSDSIIKERVYAVFVVENALRRLDYFNIDVRVKDRVVWLTGYVMSTIGKTRIENIIRGISCILEIKNNLILDDDLAFEVAALFENLERTYNCEFFVNASHGVVSLMGIVNNECVKLLAEQCAASHPDVLRVINNVHVLGSRLEL